jgi:hypothetical protein
MRTITTESAGGAAKFDSAGDYVQINVASAPSTVEYFIRGNSLSGEYVFKIQEGPTSNSLTDVVVFDSGNPISGSIVGRTNNLLSTTRFVKFIYVTKAVGNVGIDGIRIAGPGAPTVSFNPNGTTNAPVSNQFTMAVTIAPSGAGMQSWSLLPAYAGPASLTGGTFTFTPAAGDNGKTFTLSVIATNSIGTTTGTATIAVTPYVAPVPVIAFSPAAPTASWRLIPRNWASASPPPAAAFRIGPCCPATYAGTATLVGTNFTFTTAQADGPATYVFTVLATNSFGTTTGTAEIFVGTYVPPPPAGAYICTFEDGTKTGYASGDVTMSKQDVEPDGHPDRHRCARLKIGSKAARLKYDPTDGEETMTLLETAMSNGVGKVAFWYGPYGSHGTNAPTLAIEISDSLASGWVEVGAVDAGAVSVLTYYSADVYVSSPVYVRIRAKRGVKDRSANFDNIMITPYVAPSYSAYEQYLLQYNVTPGTRGRRRARTGTGTARATATNSWRCRRPIPTIPPARRKGAPPRLSCRGRGGRSWCGGRWRGRRRDRRRRRKRTRCRARVASRRWDRKTRWFRGGRSCRECTWRSAARDRC